jgi:hypothetical protein
MKGTRIIQGRWSVFSGDSNYYTGILNYDAESGAYLDFTLSRQHSSKELGGIHTERIAQSILGFDHNNNPVSLIGCICISNTDSFEHEDYKISVSSVLLGIHSRRLEDVEIQEIDAEITLLHRWIGEHYISNIANLGLSINLRELKSIDIDLKNNTERLSICETLSSRQDIEEFSLKQGHFFKFQYDGNRNLREALNANLEWFRRFLIFCIGKPVFYEKITAKAIAGGRTTKIELLSPNHGVASAERGINAAEMRVSYANIKNIIPEVFDKWFEMRDLFKDVFTLYFTTILSPIMYVQQEFLFLAQATEVYHRSNSKWKNHVLEKKDFDEKRKRILSQVDKVDQKWLEDKLSFANEKSLSSRLSEIIRDNSETVKLFIGDEETFIKNIRDSRNHYTHYSLDKKKLAKLPKDAEFMKMTHQLRTLLEICLFKELGITGSPVQKIIQRMQFSSFYSF